MPLSLLPYPTATTVRSSMSMARVLAAIQRAVGADLAAVHRALTLAPVNMDAASLLTVA